ncbi:MAG: flagellar motor switch protein FliN [Acidimicrobiales bacterium]
MSDTSTSLPDQSAPGGVAATEPPPASVEPAVAPPAAGGAHDGTGIGAGSFPSRADGSTAARSLDLLHGVEMTVTVELGRTKMLLRELLALQVGSVIELDRPAGSPVDVLINDTLLARGEVVVVDDEFGVRILDIVSSDEPTSRR